MGLGGLCYAEGVCVHRVSVSVRVIRSVGTGVFLFFFVLFHATFGLFVLMKLGWKKKGLLGMR
jgi:hypothetical protein